MSKGFDEEKFRFYRLIFTYHRTACFNLLDSLIWSSRNLTKCSIWVYWATNAADLHRYSEFFTDIACRISPDWLLDTEFYTPLPTQLVRPLLCIICGDPERIFFVARSKTLKVVEDEWYWRIRSPMRSYSVECSYSITQSFFLRQIAKWNSKFVSTKKSKSSYK